MPDQRRESVVIPIHRKGDKSEWSNYRGLSLLSTSYKILFNILLSRLIPFGSEFLSSRLLFRNVKCKIYKTIILLVVLYGCETWSLTLREEHRLMVFDNRALRRIFRPKRDEQENGQSFIMRSFIICTHP
jgi:hypothetical protein